MTTRLEERSITSGTVNCPNPEVSPDTGKKSTLMLVARVRPMNRALGVVRTDMLE